MSDTLPYEDLLIVSATDHDHTPPLHEIVKKSKFKYNTYFWDQWGAFTIRCQHDAAVKILKKIKKEKLSFVRVEREFRFKFTGVQVNALGLSKDCSDTYKCFYLGEAIYKLYAQYDKVIIKKAFENRSAPYSYVPLIPISLDIVKSTKLIKCNTDRETPPNTGTYKHFRHDAPVDYKW